ncbi:MAG: hypothetical protein QNJ54_12035 [Prochloraceae cyanobacterium]|nr:hypothetical protein [Prochloraceae cyanobacterium]
MFKMRVKIPLVVTTQKLAIKRIGIQSKTRVPASIINFYMDLLVSGANTQNLFNLARVGCVETLSIKTRTQIKFDVYLARQQGLKLPDISVAGEDRHWY